MSTRQLEMIFKTTKTGTGEKQAVDGLKDLKKGASGALQELTGLSVGTMGLAGGLTILAAGLGAAVRGAMEAETITADLNATIKSTHSAAGMTADEIQNMAQSFSDLTGIEDDSIVKGQSMLLTFTNIGKDVFPMATEAMLNMTAKFGSMESASVQLGKALNDPVLGVTALRRVGVMLTDEQEKQIKSFMAVNDIASAQKIILGELGTEFGGLAEAMGDTTQGKINKAKNAIGNLGETIGGILLPFLGDAADALTVLVKGIDELVQREKKQKQAALDTTETYDDYIKKLSAQYKLDKSLIDANGKVTVGLGHQATAVDILTKAHGALTEMEYNLEKGMYNVNETGMIQAGIIAEAARSTGVTTQTLVDYANAMADAGQGAGTYTDYLKGVTGATEGVTGAMQANIVKQGELDKSTSALAKGAMSDLTREFANQQIMSTLTGDAQLEFMRKQGLVKESTYQFLLSLQSITKEFDLNKDGVIDAYEATEEYRRRLAALDGMTARTEVITKYTNIGSPGSPTVAPGGPTVNQSSSAHWVPPTYYTDEWGKKKVDVAGHYSYYAAGGSWVIPDGYNENYPVGPGKFASSGETVTVTPNGKDAPAPGITFTGPVYMNSAKDIDILAGKLTAYWQRQGRN